MGAVINLDEHRPHVTITTQNGRIYVIQTELFEDIARGHSTVDSLIDRDDIMRLVVAEWLDLIGVEGAAKLREIED